MTQHELTRSEEAWVNYYRRRAAEGFASVRKGMPPSSRARVLSMVRYAAPNAYAAIIEAQLAAPPVVRIIRQPDSGETIEVPS
jgi:hypothetical protein